MIQNIQRFSIVLQFSKTLYQIVTIINKMENVVISGEGTCQTSLMPLLNQFCGDIQESFQEGELDDERCYLMEIEQLKRENNFLKKKIAELSRKNIDNTSQHAKRRSLPSHIQPPIRINTLPHQHYVAVFFEEITRLLQSFNYIFKLPAVSPSCLLRQDKYFAGLQEKSAQEIGKRLGRVLLESQEKRYGQLLNIFEEYYLETTQKTAMLKSKVESLTMQAIELGKQMAERVRTREKTRRSHIFSSFQENVLGKYQEGGMKESFIKSTCTDENDITTCKNLLASDSLFQQIF